MGACQEISQLHTARAAGSMRPSHCASSRVSLAQARYEQRTGLEFSHGPRRHSMHGLAALKGGLYSFGGRVRTKQDANR